MRSSRLAPAAVVAASVLALTPAGAAARKHPHKHPSPSGRCAVNLNVAPTQITAGDSIVAFGRLRCVPRANAAGQTVQLFEHSSGVPGYARVQSTSTDSRGFYELVQANVQTDSSFYVRAHHAQSGRRRVRVATQVTLSGPPEGTQLLTGHPNRVTFTGTVSPADVGARVILQRQNALTGDDWRQIDRSGVVGPGGTFTIVHTFVVPGDANLRVIVRSHGIDVPSASNVLTYEISQAQNPRLTINASADPISFGQSVTISGVASGVTSAPVTLLARTVRQHGFAPVAQVNTDASGNYSFPAQSPVNSTFYEVAIPGSKNKYVIAHGSSRNVHSKAAFTGTQSAVLYEGVKDALTASVSQSTIQAGRTLTFSGTVAPDHSGHIIYLERQNIASGNFHVVEVATVGAGSAYAIAHTVYDPGTKVFRVRIPGGPENEGAASAPFTIQVTPAPAASLTPESPGNSGLPAEGEH